MPRVRHIVAFSGGKDSSALAVYLHDPARWRHALGKRGLPARAPLDEAEYVFCDTGAELAETYDYLDRLEAYLGRPVLRLRAEVPPPDRPGDPEKSPFDHYLELYGGFLPSPRMRWCTRQLKLKPFEDYIGEDPVVSYVGIRADEDREGYLSTKPNISTVFPFREDGITKDDVYRILDDAGLGRPDYYRWRSRSGCYFCFFQRRSEWVGLLEHHPDLFVRAKAYEKTDPETGERYAWSDAETLDALALPERVAAIKAEAEARRERLRQRRPGRTLMEQFFEDEVRDAEDDAAGCSICHL
jgi:3'-phosphoadenosine 5'-phosphosulfate sulfotransferase (PAPS reductase)/FAD synthetase